MKVKINLFILNFIYFTAFLSIGFILFNDVFVKQGLSFYTIPAIIILITLNYFIISKKETLI